MNSYNLGKMITKYTDTFQNNLDECESFKLIIEDKFKKNTIPYIQRQVVFYFLVFIVPYLLDLFGHLEGYAMKACLTTSLVGAFGMYFYEIIDMYVGGRKVYFKDKWNWIDSISLLTFIAYYTIRIYIANNPDEDNIALWECAKLVNCFVLTFIWAKISWFLKLYSGLGLMTQLIVGVMNGAIPFLVLYLFWVGLFVLISYNLGNNEELAQSYSGISTNFVAYFLVTFENSLGNISNPTINWLKGSETPGEFFLQVRAYFIYVWWFLAQIFLLVILLNFVIALIG